MKKNIINKIVIFVLLCALTALTACSSKQSGTGKNKTLVFADAGWDSIRFHNDVATFILEKGYGYKTDVLSGSSATTFTGLRNGDIDILMELWGENIQDIYNEAIKNGEIVDVSINFDDNAQGLYVPKYVISGDPARGIKPVAPDLKTVKDLAKYKDVFKDPEDPSKGRIYGSPSGWSVDKMLREKVKAYGLDKTYNYFGPGSDSALSASIASAVEKGEPWVGYYWEPTWVIGKYDMVLLEDEPYSKEKWENGYACEFPSQKVTIAVNKDVVNKAPDAVEFLKKYKTSSDLTSKALAYMQDNNVGTKEAAEWFLKENEDIWTKWVPDDIASKVKQAL
ncbi:MAG TPA: ABC transporter substrate-binding protein [Clostridiaceae bacterium]|nr:ABC transporter substrate-binding protein [Clostridiaceae bacterium]